MPSHAVCEGICFPTLLRGVDSRINEKSWFEDESLLVVASRMILPALTVSISRTVITMRATPLFQDRALLPNDFGVERLDCYCCPHVWSLLRYANSLCPVRGISFVNYVKQHLTYFSSAGADRMSLFILEGVDRPIAIERQDYRFCVQIFSPRNRRQNSLPAVCPV